MIPARSWWDHRSIMPDLNTAIDNEEFPKTIKPLLSDQVATLIKKNENIISEEFKVANLLSNLFGNAVSLLGIKNEEQFHNISGLSNPADIAIKKFVQHPSINLIKENVSNARTFSSKPAEIDDIIKEISNLDNKNNGSFENTPTYQSKDVLDICRTILVSSWKELC